jgi:hypothetical protein
MSAPHPFTFRLPEQPRHARVAWRLYGRTGHGSWLDPETVRAAVESMNQKYGAGTHWLEWGP